MTYLRESIAEVPLNKNVRYTVRDVAYLERIVRNRQLRRLDLDVMFRILTVLSENSTMGITNLQMRSGINHFTCIRHLKVLERLELVTLIVNAKNKNVSITQKGRDFLKLLT